MTFYILRRKNSKTNKKPPNKVNETLPTKPPIKRKMEIPQLNIYQAKERHWSKWEVKVAKRQDAALEERELLFSVAGSYLISSVKMQLHFQVKHIWKQKYQASNLHLHSDSKTEKKLFK